MSKEVLKLLLLVTLPSIYCDVIIEYAKNHSVLRIFDDDSARFGENLPSEGLLGLVVPASPLTACSAIKPPPDVLLPEGYGWIAIIKRGSGKDENLKDDCTFQAKVERAMEANFSAVIVFNNEDNNIISMGGDRDDLIPSVFVGKRSGEKIVKNYIFNHTQFVVKLTDDTPFDINNYLLPFAIVVGICFIIMLAIMIFKCIQDRRREYRHRLPKSSLKKIPTKKFVAGDEVHYETCCICLDDYVVGDKLRILPCEHAYHVKCIDPWLLKNKRVCPQCRKKVFASGDSDSETEDERAPLLARPRIAAAHTAFTPHVENPFQRAARRMANRAVSESGSSTNSSTVSSSPETDGQLPTRILGNQLTAEVHTEPPASANNTTHLVQIEPVEEEMVQIEPLDRGIEPNTTEDEMVRIEPLDGGIEPNTTEDEMVHFKPIQEDTPPLQYIQNNEDSSPVQSDTAVEMFRPEEASGDLPPSSEDAIVRIEPMDTVTDQSDPQVYIQQPGDFQVGVEGGPGSQVGVTGSPGSQGGVAGSPGSQKAAEEPNDDHCGDQIV